MATFYDDFDYAASAAIGDQTGWTKQRGTSTGTCDGSSNVVLAGANDAFWSFDTAGTTDTELDVVAKVKVTAIPTDSTNRVIGYWGFAIGEHDTVPANYRVIYQGTADAWALVQGPYNSSTTVTSFVASSTAGLATPVADTWLWIRMHRDTGTQVIKARVWLDGDGEPTTEWPLSMTNSVVTTMGPLLAVYGSSGQPAALEPVTVAWLGVGTAGDTAPTSAGASGAAKMASYYRMLRSA